MLLYLFFMSPEGSPEGSITTAANTVTPTATPAQTTENVETPQPELGSDGKPFDAERAKSTIESIRESEKALKSENAKIAKELKEAQDKIAQSDREKMTEQERLSADAKAADERAASSEGRISKTTEVARAKIVASDVKAVCSDPSINANPTLVMRLLDMSKVEFVDVSDDDPIGNPKNLRKILDDLFKEAPELKKGATAPNSTIAPTQQPGTTNGAMGDTKVDAELQKKTNAFYNRQW
jgi:hypothetical protein